MDNKGEMDNFNSDPLVDALAVPVILLSAEKEIVSLNQPAVSMLSGHGKSCFRGRALQDLLCPESSKAVLAHLSAIENGTSPLDAAIAQMRCRETIHCFLVSALRHDDGALRGFICQSADVFARAVDFQIWRNLPDDLPKRRWQLDLTTGGTEPHDPDRTSLQNITTRTLGQYLESIHPDDVISLKTALASLVATIDSHFTRIYRVKTPRDGDRTIQGSGVVSNWSRCGIPLSLSIMEVDVTDIVEEPSDLISQAESERRWKTAVLSANQAVWDHDFERDRHYLSKTWRDLRGLSGKDHIPKTTEEWLTTIHEQDVDHIKEELRRIDVGETDIINYKFRQRHKTGHWVWFLSRGRVVRRNAEGLPVRIIGTDTDITDLKTVELESQRMAQRLDVAMDAAGMARWEYNVATKEAYWDDRLLKMFGVKDGKNIRATDDWARHIHPEDRAETVAYSKDCIARKEDLDHDYRLMTENGEVKYVRVRGKYVEHPETEPRYYGVNFDITDEKLRTQELEKARALLEHESRHDALTGLANRRRLDEAYSEYLETSGARAAVLHFDIDHFKQINDTLGHDAGDATLKHAAQILQRNTPDTALVSRVGGDEFVALLVDAPGHAELETIASSIIEEMSQPFFYDAQECKIGTSIGLAAADGLMDRNSNLFMDADLALYEAKKAGRGRYRFYTASMKEEARRRKNSFDKLSAGFENGEITCHYQPQFDAVTLKVSGLEALVRWESEKFGLILPQEFLQTAEDMGLLPQVDDLVLRRALHDIKEWQQADLNVPPISVNVSAHRLNDPSLGDRLRVLDLPRNMLSFELLESAFLDARNDVISENLRVISSLGIDIEIDDFGSGHASIASLLEIAPKRLKIDRSLIRPIVQSRRQRDLVKTIIGIGDMLGIRVVAEGVESDGHIKILQDMGCCYLQGFGLSHPMSPEETALFLASQQNLDGDVQQGSK